jgi:ATP-dependent RNA helicase RhlE
MSFENLKLIEPIKRALKSEGYSVPTPIQEKSIPIILQQKDLLGCAQTGTGKTAAFAIPMLQLLQKSVAVESGKKKIKALIITPTRELAIQIGESFTAYGKYTAITHTVIFGGVSQRPQTNALQKGIDVLIATPGRLIDLINQQFINLNALEIFVLDEADRMLDMGFINDIKKILRFIPERRQSLFFSATMPPEIVKLAEKILQKPVKVDITPESATADTIQQSVYFVDKANKNNLLLHVLKDKKIETALVFTRTKYGADKVTKMLLKEGIKAEAIHGNKSQNNRQQALANFKSKTTRVLVATDIAARGIDVDELSHVINFEIPNIPETYVHRIGRTGRAGLNGISLSFCDADEQAFLRDIHKLIAKSIPSVKDHPYPMLNTVPSPAVPQRQPNNPQYRRLDNNTASRNESRDDRSSRWGDNSRNKENSRDSRQPVNQGANSGFRGQSAGNSNEQEVAYSGKPKRKWYGTKKY